MPVQEIRQFFQSLYGDDAPGFLPLVTFLDQKARVEWFPASEQERIAERAEELSAALDVYFGIGLHGEPHGQKRGTAEEVIALPGLWLELDWADPAHKKSEKLPPSQDAALSLLDTLPAEPTLLLASGHGFHVWWAFREPWLLETDGEYREAAALERRLQGHFQEQARARGWTIDNTSDLARVLRPAGTWNRKREPVPVVTIHDSGPRYNPRELAELIPQWEAAPEPPRAPESESPHAAADPSRWLISGERAPRHDVLRAVSVRLAERGLPPSTIYAALRDLRDRHTAPGRPIPDAELLRLATTAGEKYGRPLVVEPSADSFDLIDMESLLGVDVPTHPLIIPGWTWQDTMLLVAPGGTSKSLFTFSVALSLAGGAPVLGQWPVETPARVLVIQEEDPPDLSTLRLQRLARGMGLDARSFAGRLRFVPFRSGFWFGNEGAVARLDELVDSFRPQLIVADSISKVAAIADQNKREEVTGFFRDHVDRLKRDHQAGVLLVHHANKLAHQKVQTVQTVGLVTGSQAFVDNADSVAVTQGVPQERDRRTFTWVKVRSGAKPPPWSYTIEDLYQRDYPSGRAPVRLIYEGEIEEDQTPPVATTKGQKANEILLLNRGAWVDSERLRSLSDCSERTLQTAAKDFCWETRQGGGRGSKTEYRVKTTKTESFNE